MNLYGTAIYIRTLELSDAEAMLRLEVRDLDQNYAFGVFLRGSLQICYVGYYLDRQQNGKGVMSEVGVMPHNLGSIKVLEKAGFHKEGIARQNVKINGRWEDHQVLAIVNEADC